MADNYTRQGQTFRAEDFSNVIFPVVLVGTHVRTYSASPQTLVVSATVQTLTVPAGFTHADIYAQGSAATDFCRYFHGGGIPTGTSGVKLGDHELIASADPSTFRVIQGSGGGNITLFVEFYRYA